MNDSSHEIGGGQSRLDRFQTTSWSLILSARDGDSAEAREALARLCEIYWYPLYAFVRRKGYDPDLAQDLVQGFFARLLEKDELASVRREKGKFRSFLMTACDHFLSNRLDHDRAKKRGGGRSPISIDQMAAEGRYGLEPMHHLTAEKLYDRQWAITLLDDALETLKIEMSRLGKARLFEVLRPALLGEARRTPYDQIAIELGLSLVAARAAAHRLRGRYRDLIREEVARTIDDPADLDEEIRSIFDSLAP